MKGAGNEWVRALELRGRMDWEWIETYPEQVYFATRHDSVRNGDIVTMWTRVEYKHPQTRSRTRARSARTTGIARSATRSTSGVFFYKWNNLQTDRDDARAVHQPAPLVGEDREGHGRRDAVQLRLQHPQRDAGHQGPEPPKN